MRACGCLGADCICTRDRITEAGTFRMMCRCCRLVWEGTREHAMGSWDAHIRTPEHEATAKVEMPRIHIEDAEREFQKRLATEGALF